MTGFLDIEMVGEADEVNRMLTYLEMVLSPIGLALFLRTNVGPYLRDRARDRFFSEGDDVTGPWAPLQLSTQEIRSRLQVGPDHPINVRSGELEDYVTQSQFDVSQTAVGVTLQYPSTLPKTQSLKEKMRTAQSGRSTPSTVARPVLGMNERDLAFVLTSLAYYIQAGTP